MISLLVHAAAGLLVVFNVVQKEEKSLFRPSRLIARR
jgi:hypothetical protein